jgi:VIT1/CCC1 family predicted Fe2+/Mn2+ transporter
MNPNDQGYSVSLKEHLLALLADDRELAAKQSIFIDQRFELADKAVQLAHVEILRRLDLLNHAHEEARQKEVSFVGREVYESQTKDHNKWRDEVNSALSTRQGRASVTSGLAGAVGGLALSALFALIMYLAKALLTGVPK